MSEAWMLAQRQLALDFACCAHAFERVGVRIYEWRRQDGRREFRYPARPVMFAARGEALVISAHRSFIPLLHETFLGQSVSEALGTRSLARLEARLEGEGMTLYGPDIKFLRVAVPHRTALPTGVRLAWYEGAAIRALYAHEGFHNALLYERGGNRHDALALAAFAGDRPIGIAGASADSDAFWQIGIDVVEGARCRGLAKRLVGDIATAIEARCRVPYYSTWPSNIASQRVALACGFAPAWVEYYVKEIPY